MTGLATAPAAHRAAALKRLAATYRERATEPIDYVDRAHRSELLDGAAAADQLAAELLAGERLAPPPNLRPRTT